MYANALRGKIMSMIIRISRFETLRRVINWHVKHMSHTHTPKFNTEVGKHFKVGISNQPKHSYPVHLVFICWGVWSVFGKPFHTCSGIRIY